MQANIILRNIVKIYAKLRGGINNGTTSIQIQTTMSEFPCRQCKKKNVRHRQEAVQCEQRSHWQHRTCDTGISRADYRQAVKGNLCLQWRRSPCTQPEDPEPELQIAQEEPTQNAVEENSIVIENSFHISNQKTTRQTQCQVFQLWRKFIEREMSTILHMTIYKYKYTN